MRALRVLVLVREGLEPPGNAASLSAAKRKTAEWRTEFDVAEALRGLGHRTRVLGVYSDPEPIRRAVTEWQPHVTFNLLEEWAAVALYDQNVVAYLELLGARYTGCNPRGLVISRDKALSKKLLAYHGIRVPEFQVFPAGRRARRPRGLAFPLFVKSAGEHASLGISQASLVRDDAALAARVKFIHEKTGGDAIAERFIAGRELYVAVAGNGRLCSFPARELLRARKSDAVPLIATRRAKWDPAYQKRWGIASWPARNLPDGLTARLGALARRIYRLLCLSGYARIDFRLSPEGGLYFLEANPNPQLARGEDFAESARAAGVAYPQLLDRLLRLGRSYRAVRG